MKNLCFYLFGILIYMNATAAPVTIYSFDSKEKEKIFYKLGEEIRCLVCQNQNIAESNSELAQDLRAKIYDMLMKDKTEDEITAFMVERYGDYVLFDPPFKPITWLLWLGPLLVFIVGAVYALIMVKSKSETTEQVVVKSSDQNSRLDQLKSEISSSDNEGDKQ